MSAFSEILDNITDLAETTEPYAPIVYGSDPPLNGICMTPAGGYPSETYMDKGMLQRVPVLLNGKHIDQETVLETLEAIHAILTKRLFYSDLSTEGAQVVNIATTAAPAIIGREQNSQWICGSSFEVSFYWR